MKQLFVLYDNKAQEIVGAIMTLPHPAVAIRTYGDAINGNKHIYDHVEDYDLYYLGNLDETTGAINSEPRVLLTGQQWRDNQITEKTLQLAREA